MSHFPRLLSKADQDRIKGIINHLPDSPREWTIERNVITTSAAAEKAGRPRQFEVVKFPVEAETLTEAKALADGAKVSREAKLGHRHGEEAR